MSIATDSQIAELRMYAEATLATVGVIGPNDTTSLGFVLLVRARSTLDVLDELLALRAQNARLMQVELKAAKKTAERLLEHDLDTLGECAECGCGTDARNPANHTPTCATATCLR